MITVSVRDKRDAEAVKYYRVRCTPAFADRHNNFMLFSIGWNLGEDLPVAAFAQLRSKGLVEEITFSQWNHMGCQSSCVERGGTRCSW